METILNKHIFCLDLLIFALSSQKKRKSSLILFFFFLKDDLACLVNVKLIIVISRTIFCMIILCGQLVNIKYMTSSLAKEKWFKLQKANFPQGNTGRNTQQNSYGVAYFPGFSSFNSMSSCCIFQIFALYCLQASNSYFIER